MMNCLWKSLKGYRKILVVVLSVALALEFPYLGEKNVKAATVVHENIEGRDGDYTYSLWKDTGDTTMTINGNGHTIDASNQARIFNINGRSKIDLQCYDNELVEDVIKKLCTKSELKYTKILIIFGNKNIKLNQSLRRNGIYENKKKLDIITDVIFGFQN